MSQSDSKRSRGRSRTSGSSRTQKPASALRLCAGVLLAVLFGIFARLRELPGCIARLLRDFRPWLRSMRSEHQAGRFPESDRRPVQFLLMLCGLSPMWRSQLRERFIHSRRRIVQLETAVAGRTGRHSRLRPLPVAAAVTAIACLAAFSTLNTRSAAAGYQDASAEGGVQARQVAAGVEPLAAKALGRSFAMPVNGIRYDGVPAPGSEADGDAGTESEPAAEDGSMTYACSLYIDGELIGSTQYEGAIEALLEQITRANVSADTLSVDFVEDVRVSEGYVPTDSLVNLGRIAEIINSTKTGEETYTVVRGDTWGKIAWEHDMSNDQLLALNPGYDIDRINIGDELILSKEVPYLTVRVTERQNYVDQINYDIDYVDDASMYRGDTRVIDKGEFGTADLVADVEYVNGIETSRTVISQVMLSEPKTETRARGTKERPSWIATGSFRWPASGRITSGFGYRNTGIRGASTNHQGIDIACSHGSPIYAADGGTVTYTGYKGAMGYTVIINHGNGYVTYYEHCSTFTCKAGDHVYKGQQIARVGSSGVASGAHCHFGVQKNGTYVNPMNYLP